MRKMEEEIFKASAKDRLVKVVGIKLGCNLGDLRIYVNGVDITKNFVLEEVRIVTESKPAEVGVIITGPEKKAE
jgi:IS4 transposase